MKGNPVKTAQHIAVVLSLFITLPISHYLLYKLLVATNASLGL